MSLFKVSNRKRNVSYVSIFDIGSGSIGSALVRFEKGKVLNIVWSKRMSVTFKETTNTERLMKSMLATLLDMALQFQMQAIPMIANSKEKTKNIDDVFFVFSPPWYTMRSKVFNILPKDGTDVVTITEQFVKNLIVEEEKDFKDSLGMGSAGLGYKIIEEHIVQSKINGYSVLSPYGIDGKQAQIDLVLSAIPTPLYENVLDISKQLQKRERLSLSSFALSSFLIIRDIFHDYDNFLMVDINAEVVDISIVRKGTLVETTSFKLGRNFIVRQISEKLNTVPEEALSLLRIYFDGHIDENQKTRIKDALDDIQVMWLTRFKEALKEISAEVPMSKNIFLTADNDFVGWFKDTIDSGTYDDLSFSDKLFNIIVLDDGSLEKYCAYNKLTAKLDPFLAIEALYYQKAYLD